MAENRNWLQRLFGNLLARKTGLSQVKIMAGYTPVFTPWGTRPYEADVVRAAVDAIARNAAKLKARHIRRVGGDVIPQPDSHIQRLLQFRPNPRMSAYDFLYKLVSTALLDNNAWAYPYWREGRLDSIWPINCTGAELLEDDEGELYVKFYFAQQAPVVLPYADVIHIRRHFYDNDLLGSPNDPINATLSVLHTTREGLAQAVKTSAHLRGLLKFSGQLKESDISKARERFVQEYLSVQNTGGIAALDAKADYVELNSDPKMVDADQMKELRDMVFRYFGVNESIIMGRYTEDEWNAFYESTIEPLAVQLSLEFTTKLFSDREIGHGNEIVFEANRLQYASVRTKLQLVQLVDRGIMTPNQLAEVFNLPPVPGGDVPIRRLDTRPIDETDDLDDEAQSGGGDDADSDAGAGRD